MSVIKGLLKDLFFLANTGSMGANASILSYHNIGDDDAFFTVSIKAFGRQLELIRDRGHKVVFLSELIRTLRDKKDVSNMVALTFNNGYVSAYADVLPLLKKYNMPASVFVTVEYMDTNIQTSDGHSFKTLSLASVREMIASGLVEFFPQTQHRLPLDSVAFEHAVGSIEQARKDIESIIQKEAPVFSYPKGRSTKRIEEYLRAHLWLGAVGGKEGLVHADSDPFFLPRNSVDSRTSFIQFKGKLSTAIDAYARSRT
jgi:peptidoglycan/xylan/chitin deacetylase (PgdA/CDA1 family)